MKNLSFLLITAILFLFAQSIFSQGYQKGNFQGTMPMDGKITGTIIDSITGQPVEYAIVAIHKMKDSSLVTGNTTKTNGSFIVEGLPYGRFYAEITFVGYKKHVVRGILITPNQNSVNIGSVKIEPSSTDINAVVVTGNKPAIEYKLDKKVVDVTQSVVAAGGTVVDALQNVPSIQADIQGNVTLRGSSNFTVLIDGRPSPLTGSEALQQIPASLVQNVEIITNPSAKYDAEGSAGIINIVMKKQKVKGFNGILNLTVGNRDKYSGSLNLNYMISKFNFSLGADFTDMKYFVTDYFINSDTLAKKILDKQTINGNGNFHRSGKGLKAGIDYNIDDKNRVSLSGNIGTRNFDRSFNSTYEDDYINTFNSESKKVYYLNNNSATLDRQYYNLNLDYQLKLNNNGHKLSASAYFSKGPDNNLNYLMEDTTDANWVSLGKVKIMQQTAQNTNEAELRTNVDYSYPFSEKGKLEAGYQGRYADNKGTYDVSNFIGNVWKEDSSQMDKIDFKDQIQAGYVTLSNSFILFDYQLGLRVEYENRNFNQQIINKDYKLERADLFPTIHLSKQLPWDFQLQASYTRRIDRPRDWNLDPLKVYVDPLTIRMGNADLKPQFTDSYELNLEKKLNDASFISAEGFYRQTSNLIQQFTSFDSTTQIRTLSFTNIDHDRSVGLELMINLIPAKWFIFNSSWSIFNYKMFGTPNPAVANSTNTWNLRINPTFKLKWGTAIQINYIYNAPTITAQGTRSGFYSSAVGLKQDLLKRKGSLTLQIQNPFGYSRFASTTNTPNLYSYNWFQRESKVFMFTFNYRINNYKAQKAKTQQDDNSSAPDTDMMGNP
jgi:outer membrane receptor protein involved in Fe transport